MLLRVRVALTCGTDLKVWKQGFHARMIQPPALFGHELSGTCRGRKAVNGRHVRMGARVVPSNSAPCNDLFFLPRRASRIFARILFSIMALMRNSFASPGELSGRICWKFRTDVSFEDAAMIEPLACVLRGIHETGIQPGDTVVVIGCGPIGLKFTRFFHCGECA